MLQGKGNSSQHPKTMVVVVVVVQQAMVSSKTELLNKQESPSRIVDHSSKQYQ